MPKLCPVIKAGYVANPNDGMRVDCGCEESLCAWWTGEECAVLALVKNTKLALPPGCSGG